MAEIYRDDTTKVAVLGVTGATVTSVKFVRNGADVPANASAGTVPIPYAITHIDGDFDVVWNYTIGGLPYTRTETNHVVTPYFTATELAAHDEDFAPPGFTQAKVVKLERLVRGIIDAYVGQSFGLEAGTVEVYGAGDSILHSSKRIVTVDKVAFASSPTDEFYFTYRPINQGFAIESTGYGNSVGSVIMTDVIPGGVIKAPPLEEQNLNPFSSSTRTFRNNVAYLITGTFGYRSVPFDVNLAALHLAEEFSCDETLWRDRYIKSISGEGFDIEFRSDAFNGTGSVTADQLLGKYIANKLAIV